MQHGILHKIDRLKYDTIHTLGNYNMRKKAPSTATYLFGRHAITLCLQHQGQKNYYASAQSLWLWHTTKNIDALLALATHAHITTHIAHSLDDAPEEIRLDLKEHHHILYIQPILPPIEQFDWENAHTILVVDHITDAQNLGAIVRSACALGVDAIWYPKHDQADLTPRVRFIAQGAAEIIPCYRITNINQWLKKAQDKGFWIYGFSEKGCDMLHTTVFSPQCVLVIGSEDRGIRAQTEAYCDFLLRIPTHPHFSCLNAASASSIIMYERHKQILQAPS